MTSAAGSSTTGQRGNAAPPLANPQLERAMVRGLAQTSSPVPAGHRDTYTVGTGHWLLATGNRQKAVAASSDELLMDE